MCTFFFVGGHLEAKCFSPLLPGPFYLIVVMLSIYRVALRSVNDAGAPLTLRRGALGVTVRLHCTRRMSVLESAAPLPLKVLTKKPTPGTTSIEHSADIPL